jgi:hypothetical protein
VYKKIQVTIPHKSGSFSNNERDTHFNFWLDNQESLCLKNCVGLAKGSTLTLNLEASDPFVTTCSTFDPQQMSTFDLQLELYVGSCHAFS